MSREMLGHFEGWNLAQLINVLLENVAADPTGAQLIESKLVWQSVAKRIKAYDGTTLQTVAWLSDLTALGRFRGQWDVTAGTPTAAGSTVFPGDPIRAGDYWRVSVGGTIAGIGGGSATYDPGDVIFADAAAAAAPANFFGVQANLSEQNLLNGQEQTIVLVASTPLVVTPSPVGKVISAQFFDSTTNNQVYPDMVPAADGSTLTVTSLVAKTLVARMSVDPV